MHLAPGDKKKCCLKPEDQTNSYRRPVTCLINSYPYHPAAALFVDSLHIAAYNPSITSPSIFNP